ncbi:MAG: hypothetical protein SFT68_01440 [Rickettsiaceae bacterium]|nr:hypothetical protein [Rickettsiaceae bacterium]
MTLSNNKVIFLNGCTSSGKSSIIKAIQHESESLWIACGIDIFIQMMPYGRIDPYLTFTPEQNQRGPSVRVDSGPEGPKLFDALPQLATILAAKGNNLIIDEVLLNEKDLFSYAKYLKDFTVYYIGVFCDLEIMREREIFRRNRFIGLANDQIDRVHKGVLGSYDFRVDTTSISPSNAARLILKFINESPAPKAFASLASNS